MGFGISSHKLSEIDKKSGKWDFIGIANSFSGPNLQSKVGQESELVRKKWLHNEHINPIKPRTNNAALDSCTRIYGFDI